jgi:glycosyl transferase family 4
MTGGGNGKRVVLVAPEFPPSNTAGAHRPRLFAKHLGEFGWTPTVLTIRRDQIEGPLDPMLEELVSPDLDIRRTGALPVRPVRIIGDIGIRSLANHAVAVTGIARRHEVDAVVLFGPPWFSFLLGPWVRRAFRVPYVIDYIDPWMSDWTASHPFPTKGWLYHHLAAAIEPTIVRSAAHVTAVSPGILAELQVRYPWLASDRVSAMPYGAEPDDLVQSEHLGLLAPDFSPGDGAINICFTGAIQPKGGEMLRAVLNAARSWREENVASGRRARLHFYGTSNLTWGHDRHAVLPIARELGVADMVSEMPERIPYLRAMAVLRTCDIVLVMGSTAQSYDASKLYPAIVSGRPILALCHEQSSIRRVMDETGAGVSVTFSEVGDVQDRVPDIRRAFDTLASRPARRPDPAIFERFTARASTAALAGILDRVTARPPVDRN